ncbi:MAG: hypothetical protein ACXW6V_23300 [Candidatus Binatia bacterium]
MTWMSDSSNQPEGREHQANASYGIAAVLGLFAVLALIALPFLPLLMSLCEGMVFGTRPVEAFCERIGIHDELGSLYQAVFDWFQ